MIHEFWRLSEAGDNNLGLARTDEGLVLGRTSLVERRAGHFIVREQSDIERLLTKAYQCKISADRLMPGLTIVASALNANDQCLARIAAVHLRIPDLPDRATRDAMESEDILIKSIDWNPELHPRTGVPPNPGWFAPTGGAGVESFSVRTAENDDPTRRTDASASAANNDWVRLSPAQGRIDELEDFIEWIANAKPEDEKAIRAEIKRYFTDVGDEGSAHALNAHLTVLLRPGITRRTDSESFASWMYIHVSIQANGFISDTVALLEQQSPQADHLL